MSVAIFHAMVLGLVRDRGALLMSFFLPAVFFVIMAEIFTTTSGETLQLTVVVRDELDDDASNRLVAALQTAATLTVTSDPNLDREAVRALVKSGTYDVGLIVRADGEPLDSAGGFGAPPLLIVSDPARGVATPMLAGQIRRAYFSALPDVAMGNVIEELENQFLTLTEAQHEAVTEGLTEMRAEAQAGREVGWSFEDLLAEERVTGGESVNLVAYSAGAVAFLFLLFASVHGAVSLLEEQETGILDRVLAGPGGINVLINGKLMYLVAQGGVQVGVIFVAAWLIYDVDLPGSLGPWLVITMAASLAAAGLAMLLATACNTRRQAQTVANTAILVVSAIGGSMVPRFFMPQVLRDIGWFTPNTWALEAYSGVFWRQESLEQLVLPIGLLAGVGIVGWRLALTLARRRAYGSASTA